MRAKEFWTITGGGQIGGMSDFFSTGYEARTLRFPGSSGTSMRKASSSAIKGAKRPLTMR